MVAITVTIPTVIGNRYRAEVRPSTVMVRASKFGAPLIKSSNVTLPLRGKRIRVAIESPRRIFTSMPSIIFGLSNAANEDHRAARPTAPADLETEMAEEEGSEMAGPVRTSPTNRQPYSA